MSAAKKLAIGLSVAVILLWVAILGAVHANSEPRSKEQLERDFARAAAWVETQKELAEARSQTMTHGDAQDMIRALQSMDVTLNAIRKSIKKIAGE